MGGRVRAVGIGMLIAFIIGGIFWERVMVPDWHYGAPVIKPYACPAGDHFTVTWEHNTYGGPGTFVYHGWTESGGCAATLQATVG